MVYVSSGTVIVCRCVSRNGGSGSFQEYASVSVTEQACRLCIHTQWVSVVALFLFFFAGIPK